MDLRERLIRAGVIHLKQFGYPAVDEKNILTDMIYAGFFKKMLEETADVAAELVPKEAALALLAEVEKNLQGAD